MGSADDKTLIVYHPQNCIDGFANFRLSIRIHSIPEFLRDAHFVILRVRCELDVEVAILEIDTQYVGVILADVDEIVPDRFVDDVGGPWNDAISHDVE